MSSFFPATNQARLVPGVGSPLAKIAIIGEFTDNYDYNNLRPFSGPAGGVLDQCLHAAGLIRGEVYLTNCIKSKPTQRPRAKGSGGTNFEYYDDRSNKFTATGLVHVEYLREELDALSANILVPCGNAAMAAVTQGNWRSNKLRGYIMESRGLARPRKVLPTASPAASLRGGYTSRHLIVVDFKKAKIECEFPEVMRPVRELVYSYNTVQEALDWLAYYETQEEVATDIEVINFSISCISFSSDPSIACVIPIADRWTEDEELQIWRGVQRVLGNIDSRKVLQNGIFDIQFMLAQHGVVVRGELADTMIAHSVMFPELKKSLAFLGSIYCGAQEYWKDAVKFDNIKEES